MAPHVAAGDSQLIANFLRTLEFRGIRETQKSRSEVLLVTREIGKTTPDPPTSVTSEKGSAVPQLVAPRAGEQSCRAALELKPAARSVRSRPEK